MLVSNFLCFLKMFFNKTQKFLYGNTYKNIKHDRRVREKNGRINYMKLIIIIIINASGDVTLVFGCYLKGFFFGRHDTNSDDFIFEIRKVYNLINIILCCFLCGFQFFYDEHLSNFISH